MGACPTRIAAKRPSSARDATAKPRNGDAAPRLPPQRLPHRTVSTYARLGRRTTPRLPQHLRYPTASSGSLDALAQSPWLDCKADAARRTMVRRYSRARAEPEFQNQPLCCDCNFAENPPLSPSRPRQAWQSIPRKSSQNFPIGQFRQKRHAGSPPKWAHTSTALKSRRDIVSRAGSSKGTKRSGAG